MFCNTCGHANPDSSVFCAKCGAAMTPLAPAGAAASSAAAAVAPTLLARPRMEPPPIARTQVAGFDEELWRAAIGPKNTEYYLPRFEQAASNGAQARWHWPAFFVTGYWLLYRKMWLNALLYILVLPLAFAFVFGILAAMSGASNDLSGLFSLVFGLATLVLPPLFANQLYFQHLRNLMAKAQVLGSDRQRQLAWLDAKGGTSNIVLILVVIFGTVALIGMLAAIALPAYQDYTVRAKTTEAMLSGLNVAQQVAETYESTGSLPDNLDEAKAKAHLSPYLTSIELGPNGVLELLVTASPTRTVPMTLTPTVDNDKHITWTCTTVPAMKRYVPQGCRN